MTIDTEDQLDSLKVIGKIVAETLRHMGSNIEPGMTTAELDLVGRAKLDSFGARSAPELTYDFPGATCISINHEIAHGVPGDQIISAGDLINIDVSAEKNGFFADTGGSFIVPPGTEIQRALCRTTRKALNRAVREVKAGSRINGVGKAVQRIAKQRGYTIICNLHGHGVGGALHEEPTSIAPYFDPEDKRMFEEGMVVAIEPFLSTGAEWADEASDGWTLTTAPNYMTVQYEHTVVATRRGPIILTQ